MVGYERTVTISKFKNERVTNSPPPPLLVYKGIWRAEGAKGEEKEGGEVFPKVPEYIQALENKYFPFRWFQVVGGGEGVVGGGGVGGEGERGFGELLFYPWDGGGGGEGGGGVCEFVDLNYANAVIKIMKKADRFEATPHKVREK